jgi:tetratricopeptide (TPR) repeat protein
MRKTISLLVVATLVWVGASGQTVATKDNYSTAKQLYSAGFWSAAQAELTAELQTVGTDDVSQRVEVETLYALCAARLGQADAGELLAGLLAAYPHSPYSNEVRFRAGTFAYDNGRYSDALALLSAVNEQRLDKTELDEYCFKTAHSYFSIDDYTNAVPWFERVSANSIYGPHAEYYTAYIDYSRGDYAKARTGFFDLAANPSYEDIVPYYLFQIEFSEGNWRYVVENGDTLISHAAMPRRTELVRMVAEGWFHLEDYARALDYIDTYRSLGGVMNRPEYYLEGFSLYEEGRWREAADALSRATGADDHLSQNASYHLADAYLRLGDKGRAMQSFSIASSAGYDERIAEDALFNYGKLQYELGGGHFNEAVNILDRYLSIYPNSPRVHEVREYLIAAYYNSQNYEAAYNAIMQFPNPDNNIKAALQKITYFRALELWNMGNAQEAMHLLTTSATYRYNTKYTALAAFWQGEILYDQGKYIDAVPKYEEYLRLSPTSEPENVVARYDLGYAHFNLQQWDEAMQWFDDFLDRHAKADAYRADALNREGDIYHARREYWKAIESYDKAAAVGTDDRYYSAYQRALMLGLVERPERKIESLSAIITAGQGAYVEDAMYELGRTYISRDRYTDGANTLVQFIARYPKSEYYLPALSDLGLAYLNMGNREQSMRYYKMIVDHAPRSREAQDALAGIRGIYVDSNDVNGYFDYARQMGVRTDVGEVMRDSLSFIAAEKVYLSGDNSAAIPALQGYIRGNAEGRYLPAALYYLADAEVQGGNASAAINALSQLAGLKNNDYTIRGLQRLANLENREGRYADAAKSYRTLSGATTDPGIVSHALEGYVASVIATGNDSLIVAMADEVTTLAGTPTASLRKAQFAKAGILARGGQTAQAIEIYRKLAEDVTTPEGAESAYRVIEQLFEDGYYKEAEEAVFAFSEKNTLHSYWLGEAFLTLGDIYARGGDAFQARATWQSIVDGYSPADDGITAAAKERIANLK